ncbi:hypothetical protein [Mycobacterium szulgai]|nr:hypothetical protein [Mycobacterium szulgai]MCV7077845.1 hypothetical protein [Mycobacterium szulgai]
MGQIPLADNALGFRTAVVRRSRRGGTEELTVSENDILDGTALSTAD